MWDKHETIEIKYCEDCTYFKPCEGYTYLDYAGLCLAPKACKAIDKYRVLRPKTPYAFSERTNVDGGCGKKGKNFFKKPQCLSIDAVRKKED